MSKKAKGTSVRQRLLKLSQKMQANFSNLETVFLIERLVVRFVEDEHLRKSLVFKGGFVGLKVYKSPRYTVDLDALLVKSNLEKTLDTTKSAAGRDLDDGVWFHFEEQVDLATQGEYGGIRQVFRAGIGERLKNVTKAQIINVDLGIGDPITPNSITANTPTLLSDNCLNWSVYPIETIIAEKLHAIVARAEANSRSKDVHDLAIFLPRADIQILKDALENCFRFRKTKIPESFVKLLKDLDTTLLERGWPNAVATVKNAPDFNEAFANLIFQLERLEK
jgi:hypothetical protein